MSSVGFGRLGSNAARVILIATGGIGPAMFFHAGSTLEVLANALRRLTFSESDLCPAHRLLDSFEHTGAVIWLLRVG